MCFVCISCQGDQSRADTVPAEAGGGGEERSEGEESQPGSPEVPQAGDGKAGGGACEVNLRRVRVNHLDCYVAV